MKPCRSLILALLLPVTAVAADDWTLIFSDDFNSGSLNSENWSKFDYVKWNVADWRKFSSKDDALYQSNGDTLTLWGRYGDYTSQSDPTGAANGYAAAGLNTQGKFSFQYGKVEVRAKFDSVQGVWPAIWMLPEKPESWLGSGEIDLMEHLNYEGSAHQTLHYAANDGTNASSYTTVNKAYSDLHVGDKTQWHIYGVEWSADAITFSIDGVNTATFTSAGQNNWPFDKDGNEFYLIIDQQIGGSWVEGLGSGGINQNKLSKDGAAFEIDSVRVYTPTALGASSFTKGGVKVSGSADTVLSGTAGEADFAVSKGAISVAADAKGTVNLAAKLTESTVVNANANATLVLDTKGQGAKQTAVQAETGDITFINAGGGENLLLTELNIGKGCTVAAYTGSELLEEQEATVYLAANKTAHFGAGATLLANLVIRGGTEVTMDGALTMGSTLRLIEGENLILTDTSLNPDTTAVLLFDSVEALSLSPLGYGTVTEGRYDASRIYNSITLGTTALTVGNYDLLYQGGRVSLLNKSVVPEPTTAALALLALAGTCLRRRRR